MSVIMNSLFYVLSILVCSVVQGTLTPDGTVSLDCGSQQTFTCSVNGTAVWTISGLSGINAIRFNGLGTARTNTRITTTDSSGLTSPSTISITGFTTADNGGTIQCINLDDLSVQGMARISVGIPLCPNGVDLAQYTIRNNGCDVSLTWQQPPNTPPVTSTTVTYCPTSSPNCGNSVNCTTSTCNISGLDSGTEYQFTVIPNNNCGSPNGCTWNNVTHKVCSPNTTPTTASTPHSTGLTGLIIGVVLAIVLLALIIVIIATILICCFCCKPGSDAKNKPPREEQPRDDYADPQTVRDNKEMIERNRYVFHEGFEAGGNEKDDIHCKAKLDIDGYTEVEHLQV